MKTTIVLTVITLWAFNSLWAQMCPGGAVNFASGAITFDPAWIYGCNTGTSCNGGVNFDNRASCQPTTAMDACAPPPSCGVPANNGSNIWFKFYAAASTVTISCFQNTSFVIGVQAFTGGPTCGSLTEMGCAIAGGPSSGVNLTMTGLTPGELYYYRIFGSSGPISQRTGLYCFCGSTGLENYVLASGLTTFKEYTAEQSIKLAWEVSENFIPDRFDVEMSTDKVIFNTIAAVQTSYNRYQYSYTFTPFDNEELYYRLRYANEAGELTYSPILKLKIKGSVNTSFTYLQKARQLRIKLQNNASFVLCSVQGSIVQQFLLKAGDNLVAIRQLPAGMYFFKDAGGTAVHKISVFN